MKTLLVMRHAKSDWGVASSDDHERTLAPRGIKAARRMGRFLADARVSPQLVITSTAVRARTTVELATEAGNWDCPIVTTPEFYASDFERVLDVIAGTEPEVERVLVAGHEPTWSGLVSLLVGGARVGMSTGAVACLDLPVGGWATIGPSACELRWLVTPRMLKGK